MNPGAVTAQLAVGREVIPNTATGKVYFRITNNSPNTVAVLNTANVATALPVSLGPANIIRVNPTLNRIYVGGQPPASRIRSTCSTAPTIRRSPR